MMTIDYRTPFASARLLLLATGLCGAWGRMLAADEAGVAEKKKEIHASPEVEKKLAEVLDKMTDLRRDFLASGMKKEVSEVVKATGLDANGKAALETAAKGPIEESVKEWAARLEEFSREQLRRAPAQMGSALDEGMGGNASLNFPGNSQPAEKESWAEALKHTLTAEQAATWERTQTERRQNVEKQFGNLLKNTAEVMKDFRGRAIEMKCAGIKRLLGLSQERSDALDALGKKAVDISAENWKKRAVRWLLTLDPQDRASIEIDGQIFIANEVQEMPEQEASWKEGIVKFLNTGERDQMEIEARGHQARRTRSLGQLMLTELDRKIALTASQRERLQPLAERMMKDPVSSLGLETEYDATFQPQSCMAEGLKAPEREVRAVLDDVQWRHWQEACDPKNIEPDLQTIRVWTPKAAPAGNRNSKPSEPEDFESGISDFLFERTQKERKRTLAAMILKAEDAGRVAGLEPAVVERLKTAARGATEESLADWKTTANATVRSRVSDATVQNLKQRLGSIQEYFFQRISGLAEKKPLWEKTVAAEMTADQQSAWKGEVDKRKVFLNKSIASLILAEFDRRHQISSDQWEKLEPMIAGFISEYQPELSNYFSSFNYGRWYLQGYVMFIPFAGLPEKDIKAVLSKEQWEHWVGSNECSNSSSYMENIQQMHAQRVKEPK